MGWDGQIGPRNEVEKGCRLHLVTPYAWSMVEGNRRGSVGSNYPPFGMFKLTKNPLCTFDFTDCVSFRFPWYSHWYGIISSDLLLIHLVWLWYSACAFRWKLTSWKWNKNKQQLHRTCIHCDSDFVNRQAHSNMYGHCHSCNQGEISRAPKRYTINIGRCNGACLPDWKTQTKTSHSEVVSTTCHSYTPNRPSDCLFIKH